jgi:serine acetyltransferase
MAPHDALADPGVRGLLRQLRRDLYQLGTANSRNPHATDLGLLRLASSDGFQVLVLQRLRERVRRRRVPFLNHALRRLTTAVFGVEVGNRVSLGEGVSFVHPVGVVIGGDAVVGARVRFMGSNTVGTAKENGYPRIGDDVTLGAGCRVLGPIRVGRGATIGANAVVLDDVPEGAVVVGIPARVVGTAPVLAPNGDGPRDGAAGLHR